MENETSEVVLNDTASRTPKTIKISVKTAVIAACVIALLSTAFMARGLFIAATVDGSPISRFYVIQELEKQDGKAALDSIIAQKLIENEAEKQNVSVSKEEIDLEVQKLEKQIADQGGTLEEVISQQGTTIESLRDQIRIQLKMQKLIGETITVTDEEIQKYIDDTGMTLPKAEEDNVKEQIKNQIRDQKLNQEAQVFITNLRNDAKINYFVNY